MARAVRLDRRKGVIRVQVTAARAVPELTHRIENRRRAFGFLVRIGLELGRMTTRAVRLIRREWPSNRFAVSCVALPAGDRGVVRFEIRRDVGIARDRCPGGRGVAGVARPRGYEMPTWLTRRLGAVVALCAGAGGDIRVTECRGNPRRGSMARVARRCRLNVIWRLTARLTAVVALRARSRCYRRVVETGGNPGGRAMALIAGSGGLDVIRRFPGRLTAVVALRTRTRHHRSMVEPGGYPRGGTMTGIARRGGLDVVGRLARRHTAVMTLCATPRHHADVPKTRTEPTDGRGVTLIALHVGRNVIGRLNGRRRPAALCMAA